MSSPRAFDASGLRLLRQKTIVNSMADIKRVMQRCRETGEPCNLSLGSDIAVGTAGILAPSDLVALTIDGGGRFGFVVDNSLVVLFDCRATPVTLIDLTVTLKTGVTVTTAFIMQQTTSVLGLLDLFVTVDGVSIDATRGTMTNVFSLSSTSSSVARVMASNLSCLGVVNLFAADTSLAAWYWCRFTDVSLSGVGAGRCTVGQGSLAPAFIESVFQRFAGSFDVDTGQFSTGNLFSVLSGNGSSTFTTNVSAGAKPNVVQALSNFATITLSPDDVGDINRPPRSQTLSTAGPTITPAVSTNMRITHAAGSSGNVTIAAGRNGQPLQLIFVSYAGSAVYTDGAGNLALDSSFTPAAGDILTLTYDGASSVWREVCRSVVGGGGGGGSAAFTAVTQDLGVSRSSGTFDVVGAGLTAGKPVLFVQSAAVISSKGDARDEGEFDSFTCTAYVVDAVTIRVYWRCTGVVTGTYTFQYLVGA